MSILSVDQIQPIGSGTTVTLNATEVKTGTEITVGTGASIFSPAGNTLTFGTNNVERIRIKNDGKIGINQNNPTAKLHIVEATSTTAVKIKSGTNSNQNTHITMFNDNDVPLNLGVFGSAASTVGTIAANTAFMTSNSSGGLAINASNASGVIKFGTGSSETERLRITSDGKVGINYAATPPSETMMISSADSTSGLSVSHLSGGNRFGFRLSTISGNNKGLVVSKFANSSYTEALRIDNSGNMALGTITNAGDTLRYFDVGNFNTGSSAGSIIRLLTTKSDGTGAVGLDIVKYKSGGAYFNNYETLGTNGFIAFGTGTGGGSLAERLRITSEGYLQQHKLIAVSYSDSRAISLSNTDLTTSNFYNHTNFASDNSILDSNGHFVAPVHGIYRLYFRCTTDGVAGNRANVRLRKNGNTINEAYDSNNGSTNQSSVSSEIVMELNAGEYLDIQIGQLHTMSGSQHKQVTFHMLG